MSALDNIVFDEPGVVANQADAANDGWAFDYAVENDAGWTFFGPGDQQRSVPVDRVIDHPETASMEIESDGKTYTVRPIRFEDGLWLSKYKIGLPEEALFGLVLANPGDESMIHEDERLIARYAEGDNHVLEVLYINALGVWSRQFGTFVRVSDSLAGLDDFDTLDISHDRAEEFLDLYDRQYVSVDQAEEFSAEAPEADDADDTEE